MEPKGYELLKIETKIDGLEKELSRLFADFKKYELKKEVIVENQTYQNMEKMNVCCLNLLQIYREYVKNLKKNM
jgi:ATP-dependent helicase/DNAse subunit B